MKLVFCGGGGELCGLWGGSNEPKQSNRRVTTYAVKNQGGKAEKVRILMKVERTHLYVGQHHSGALEA